VDRPGRPGRVGPPGRLLGLGWFRRESVVVAPDLLNKVLAVGRPDGNWRWVRIVEVEAYLESDAASHAFGGPSIRNNTMFGDAAHLYVYFTYGMHWCANVVTGSAGSGQAVLLRAGEPLGGLDAMRADRGGVPDRMLCRGPARLAQALGIGGDANGAVVEARGRRGGAGVAGAGARGGAGIVVRVLDDGVPSPGEPGVGPRVGISRATDQPWRWWVPGSPWVSPFKAGRRPSEGAGRTGRGS
jgi:DNA-3-methyladenine glycosylase